jgi:glycine/D-amino acid oxidase-like deaminating enzyme
MPVSPPSHAAIVIIGGGVVGCSIAYYLVKLGLRDVLLLERNNYPAVPPGMPQVWPGGCGRRKI